MACINDLAALWGDVTGTTYGGDGGGGGNGCQNLMDDFGCTNNPQYEFCTDPAVDFPAGCRSLLWQLETCAGWLNDTTQCTVVEFCNPSAGDFCFGGAGTLPQEWELCIFYGATDITCGNTEGIAKGTNNTGNGSNFININDMKLLIDRLKRNSNYNKNDFDVDF